MKYYYATLKGTEITGVITTDGHIPGEISFNGPVDWLSRPSPYHKPYLIDGNVVWEDRRTLEDLRAEAWDRVKVSREVFWNAPLVTPFGIFDSHEKARVDIANAVLLSQTLVSVGTPSDTVFTLADNSVVTLTPSQMVIVGLLLGQKVQNGFATGRVLRAQIESPTVTKAELDEISWP